MRRLSWILLASCLGVLGSSRAEAQRSYTGAAITYDFQTYAGTGLDPAPLAGALDSDEFSITASTGTSTSTTCAYGGTCTGIFAMGATAMPVSSGGLYSFTVAGTNSALGVQPSGTAFAPNATIQIRFTNNTGATLGTVALSFDVWVRNDQGRSTTIASFLGNATTGTSVPGPTFTTPTVADTMPPFVLTSFSQTLDLATLAAPITNGGTFYLTFTLADAGGSGSRDEIAFDNVTIRAACGNGIVEGSEQCDAGAANGTTTCGCQASCTWGTVGTVCGAGVGPCAASSICNGLGACAPAFAAAGTECRAASGPCDVPEVCSGSAATCPPDLFAGAGIECRASAGVCDPSEVCTGTSASCPPDARSPSTTVCRVAMGACDVAETCNGTSATCPGDALAAAGTVCRTSAGICDIAEVCSGTGPTCPNDAFVTAGIECRASMGVCDVAETCTGLGASCPSDGRAPIGTQCRASTGVCDLAELCDGINTTCPANVSVPDGTSCADALSCNGVETCRSGACSAGTPLNCSDGNACTTDACADPGGTCGHTTIPGCCNPSDLCSDGDSCTADSCSGVGGTCTHSPITNCCHVDADCSTMSACTMDSCVSGTCQHMPRPGCCTSDADCQTGNACLHSVCGAGGTCSSTAIAGCCNTAGDCDDHDVCTLEVCASQRCAYDPIADCCAMDSDCVDADPCTVDGCDTATHGCHHDRMAGCGDAGIDAGGADAGAVDAGAGDAGMHLDGAVGDAGRDAGLDGSAADASRTDAGGTMPRTTGGCCSTVGGHGERGLALVLFGLALVARRRRRR